MIIKKMLTAVAILLTSTSSFAATIVCSNTDSNGNSQPELSAKIIHGNADLYAIQANKRFAIRGTVRANTIESVIVLDTKLNTQIGAFTNYKEQGKSMSVFSVDDKGERTTFTCIVLKD